MDIILEFLRTDLFLIIMGIFVILLMMGFLLMMAKFSKLSRRYNDFMKKLGNGKSLEEDLEDYMYRVEKVEKQNTEISEYCKSLDKDLEGCIQKIGMVRYSAFKDTGSDLSFTLAMLDENNNGVVLNGIYSREMSNIYAKPVENGKSSYTVSKEEQEAISKAVNSSEIYKIK